MPPAKPTQLSFGFSTTETWPGLWGWDDVILLWRWDTANVSANNRKPDGPELIAAFYHHTAVKHYHLFWSHLLLETWTQGWWAACRAGCTGVSSSLLGGATQHMGSAMYWHTTCQKYRQTPSFVCTELKEQDSDGFAQMFHNPPPPVLYSAAQSEPTTVIIIAIIIILIRTNDLSKYCAEDLHIFCCKTAKKAVHCWGTAPCTLLAGSTSKFLFMPLSD